MHFSIKPIQHDDTYQKYFYKLRPFLFSLLYLGNDSFSRRLY